MQLINSSSTPETGATSDVPTKGVLAAFRHAWQWLLFVIFNDPVPHVLYRCLAAIITVLTLFSMLLFFTCMASGEIITAMLCLAAMPFQILMWWLNRRGLVYGALLFVVWCVIGTTLGSIPSSYAG